MSQKAEPPWSPNELGLEISDKTVQVASGDTITITVAIVNRTKAERALDVDNCGGKAARWSTEVADARGKRVDFIARCGYGTGCGRDTRRITLLPGGRARVTVPFRAITVTENDKCDRSEAPMRPGKFTLRVLTPFRDPDPARGAAASKERFAAAPLDVK